MNEQKVCIIGDGLAGLTAAIILSKENIKIDLYCGNKKKNKKVDNRTTAISESNYQYIKKKLSFREQNLFWICKKINLFYEDKKKIINFLNFEEKNRSLMHIFQNKKLKKKLDKIVSKTKKIKVIKKNIKDINNKEGSVAFEKKKNIL